MGRLIKIESAGKERIHLARAVVVALRAMLRRSEPDQELRDLAAFIALALAGMAETIDISVAAWEKRNYWVKADRFRTEWSWTLKLSSEMRHAVLEDDWGKVAAIAAQVGQQLHKIEVSENNRIGRPWTGAWDELKKQTSS